MKKLEMLLKSKHKLKDIKAYVTGTYRNFVYSLRNHLKWEMNILMRKHIQQQIYYRTIIWIDKECSKIGICKICGCTTPALQMANKSCDKPCYPEMMNKKQWNNFLDGKIFRDKKGLWKMNEDLTLTFRNHNNNVY